MANRVQVGYPAIMKTVSKPKSIEIDEFLPPITIEKKEIVLEKDMQMKSIYLDKKVIKNIVFNTPKLSPKLSLKK